jgi:SAM-dependent methyltransferase
MKPVKVEYEGRDLEAMHFAENYHRLILELFSPFIGEHLVEVGAGTGSFSRLLLEKQPASLTLIEPSEMFIELEKGLVSAVTKPAITLYNNIFTQVADELAASTSRPDTIFYVNVLEHIEYDVLELETVMHVLADGGHVCIFVPACPALYSDFDKCLGHYRRYKKDELLDNCRAVGLEIVEARYFDMAGIVPWFLKFRLLRSITIASSFVTIYDKLVVPIMKLLENLVRPPIGKNLLVVGRKSTV